MAGTGQANLVAGKIQLFGVTDQAAAPQLITVQLYTRATATVSPVLITTGTAALNIQSMDLDQFAGDELTVDALGEPSSLYIFADGIGCRLSVVPQGGTLSDLLLAASVPPEGGWATIANAPVMRFGAFDLTAFPSGAFNSVNWQIKTAKLVLKAGGRGEIDIEIRRFVSPNMNRPS